MANIYPGINPSTNLSSFSDDEKEIIKKMGREFYVTNGGGEFSILRSKYKYFLIKPTDLYQELFGLEREIVIVFSNYSDFQPRTLDAISRAQSIYNEQTQRLEKICAILISSDNNIDSKIKNLLSNDLEVQTIIPFNYAELLNLKNDPYFFRNKFKNYFFTRDLFAFEGPLRHESYFFGRKDTIETLISRHSDSQNSGIFGLRKTGKTSLLFGIQRTMELRNLKTVYIDCQDTSFHTRRWNHALFYITKKLYKELLDKEYDLAIEHDFSPENASLYFSEAIKNIYAKLESKFMLIFDEIENISFQISPSKHWSQDNDFILFWQTIRTSFHSTNMFTFIIAGTSPLAIEEARIQNIDNPIFSMLSIEYMKGFSVEQSRDMIRKLGKIMGLKFEEEVYGFINDYYGGHPFLIRQFCSRLHKSTENEARPLIVNKPLFEKIRDQFDSSCDNYIEMIISILNQWYPLEYKMLESLAIEDTESFNKYLAQSKFGQHHIIGYGIISYAHDKYSFKIEVVKKYLQKKSKFCHENLLIVDKWKEVTERRNNIETELRKIVKKQLKFTLGADTARTMILKKFDSKKQAKYGGLSYEELFDPNKSEIYFLDLLNLIKNHDNWEKAFKYIFGNNIQKFQSALEFINEYRIEAHAAPIEEGEFSALRYHFSYVENFINEYNN